MVDGTELLVPAVDVFHLRQDRFGAFDHAVLDAGRLYLRQPASQTHICRSRNRSRSRRNYRQLRRRFPSRAPECPVYDRDLHRNLLRTYCPQPDCVAFQESRNRDENPAIRKRRVEGSIFRPLENGLYVPAPAVHGAVDLSVVYRVADRGLAGGQSRSGRIQRPAEGSARIENR